MDQVYRSKTDTWLVVALALATGASLAAAISIGVPGSAAEWTTLASCVVLGIVLPAWLLVGTRYVLGRDSLRIVSGPFRWRIPLCDIWSVTPTRNPLSSPALSLDRLRIEYGAGRKAVMISPRDRQAFLADLESRRRDAR